MDNYKGRLKQKREAKTTKMLCEGREKERERNDAHMGMSSRDFFLDNFLIFSLFLWKLNLNTFLNEIFE